MFFSGLFDANTSSTTIGEHWPTGGGAARASQSGIIVTPESAMANSAVYRAVTLLSESVASMPCELFKREGEHRKKAKEHPLYDVLRYQPNKKDTSFEYFERGQGFLGTNGNHIALIQRNKNMRVEELIPIHFSKIRVLKGGDGLPYYNIPSENRTLSMDDVHHVKGPSIDGFIGCSPLQIAADTVGLALATERHAAYSFNNGTMMNGVIEAPKEAEKITSQLSIDKLLESFSARHSGWRNMFKVAFLQEGMTYKQLAMTNEQAQLIEARKMGIADISRLYGIPLNMLSETAGESYKSVEQNTLNFLVFALLPWIKRWEAAMHRDLLLKEERSEYFIEFNLSALMRGDLKSRYEAYALGRQWGFLSVNDIRRLENLPPLGSEGDIYLSPLNMVDSKNAEIHQQLNTASPEQIKEIQAICQR
ncbi:phage portal protein [Pseudoalteromonas sp. S16_S37]|uniref:phage portal protein n=1 Tax=Pseudoalteromonas sp. S16_S37 TaxID=2720228 RepID=UPI00167FED79|nr:phage portal protein [Pseudoalteromonas sp. S16_S37]MBD1583491.1 phage portal protein [Pseudoalteromonas sp. S16_S37]